MTVTGITAANKVYDGTTAATLDTSSADLVGVVGGDDVTLDVNAAHGDLRRQGRGDGQDGDGERPGAQRARRGELHADAADDDGGHHGGGADGHGITASNKVYDGTTDADAQHDGRSAVGVVGSDDVTLDATERRAPSTPRTWDGQDGDGERPGPAGRRRGELHADVEPTTTANITAATLTVTGSRRQQGYDGTTDARSTPRCHVWSGCRSATT